MDRKSVRDHLDKQFGWKWEIQEGCRSQYVQHGIKHIRVVTGLIWYKAWYYARFPVLSVSQAEYKASQFLKCFCAYHDKQMVEGVVTFYQILYLGNTEHLYCENAKKEMYRYDLKKAEAMVKQNFSNIIKLIEVTYDKDWRPVLQHYPKNHDEEWTPETITAIAKEEGGTADQFKVEQPRDDSQLNEETRKCCEAMLPAGAKLINSMAYSSITKLVFRGVSFTNHFVVSYWLKDNRQQEYVYSKGNKFQAFFIITKRKRIELSNPHRYVRDILKDIFSCKVARTRLLYKEVPDHLLRDLYLQNTFPRYDEISIEKNCLVGDILYYKRADRDFQAAIYIGKNGVLQALPEEKTQLFKQVTVADYIGTDPNYKLIVRRLYFHEFEPLDIVELAKSVRMDKPPIANSWFKLGLHRPFELLAGRVKDCRNELALQLESPNEHHIFEM